jgi:hypothetical protein
MGGGKISRRLQMDHQSTTTPPAQEQVKSSEGAEGKHAIAAQDQKTSSTPTPVGIKIDSATYNSGSGQLVLQCTRTSSLTVDHHHQLCLLPKCKRGVAPPRDPHAGDNVIDIDFFGAQMQATSR